MTLIRGKGHPPLREPAPASPAARSSRRLRLDQPRPLLRLRALVSARVRRMGWLRMAAVGLGVVLGCEVAALALQLLRPPRPESWLTAALTPTLSVGSTQTAGSAGAAGSLATTPPAMTPPPTPEPPTPSLAAGASRPLFSAAAGTAPSAATTPKGLPSGLAKQLAARLTLSGIVSGATPQAIIQDAQTQKTYFVTVGQPVVEGASLEHIFDHHVVLDLQGEKIELSL